MGRSSERGLAPEQIGLHFVAGHDVPEDSREFVLRDKDKPVDVRFIVEPSPAGYKQSDDYIAFWITNAGEAEATITTIGWIGRAGFRRQLAQQNLGDGPLRGPNAAAQAQVR